jgi:tetratricopeptide (TPR) repeat protein
MMMSSTTQNAIVQNSVANFPMGPNVRGWLNISPEDYSGAENPSPSADAVANFTDVVLEQLENTSPNNMNHLVDLLEEFVGMNMPLLAIKLADAYPQMFPKNDFRAQLNVGNAAMLISDLARAEEAFVVAQQLVPEEPAPYINLAQIYSHDGLADKAREWCLAGLDTDQNNTRLWELLAYMEQQSCGDSTEGAKRLAILSRERNSWAGLSLSCDLINPEDVLTKLKALDPFWNEGCRDLEYLIEYTAVLGMAGLYDKIPSIIWTVEKEATNGLPWQLTLHLAQAYLGLGHDQDALLALEKLNNIADLPDVAKEAAKSILSEAQGQSSNH